MSIPDTYTLWMNRGVTLRMNKGVFPPKAKDR